MCSAGCGSETYIDDAVLENAIVVECIRVMKDRRIVVVLKGGMTVEDSF